MQQFANPQRFVRIAKMLTPWLLGVTALLIVTGLYLALFVAPRDYQQGDAARIMYVHVPAAWMSLFVYASMAVASAVAFIWKHPLADVAAKASAPIGLVFTALALITGSLWGQPMWGTWWVWDARLTSVLILFFLYLGYIVLWNVIEEPTRAARAARILALVGAVNVPIIKFSVDWWNTLHQGASVFRMDGPTITSPMLVPLLIMALGYNLFYVTFLLIRMRMEVSQRRLRTIRLGLGARIRMSDWQTFFDMGGYAAYVWPAYGVSILSLACLAFLSWRQMKRAERLVDLSEKAERR